MKGNMSIKELHEFSILYAVDIICGNGQIQEVRIR